MTMTETELKNGRVVAIAGPVVDVEFPAGFLPEINMELRFTVTVDGEDISVPAEVAQQIGEHRVRAISMKPTDGLKRGTTVINTGHGMQMPVGDVTLEFVAMGSAERLGCILNDRYLPTFRGGTDRVVVSTLSVEVDRDNRFGTMASVGPQKQVLF